MAVVFMDSCRHYRDDAEIGKKWTTNSTGVVSLNTHPSGSGSTLSLGTGQYVETSFTADDKVTCGFYVKMLSFPASTYELAHIYDASTVQIALQVTGSGQFTISRTTSTSSANRLILTTESYSANIWYYIEIWLDPEDTSGKVFLRIDGDLVGQYEGYTKGGTATTAQKFRLYNESITSGVEYADIYVATAEADFLATETTVPKFAILKPDTDVATPAWNIDPSSPTTHFTKVDDDPIHLYDNDYIYETTVSDIDKFNVEDIPNMSYGKVFAVQAVAVAKHDGTSTNFAHEVTSGATTDTGSTETPTTDYLPYVKLWAQDPNGPTAWTKSSVTTANFGVKVVA